MPSKSSRSSSRRRIRYLALKDLDTLAYELAHDLFAEWLGPMPVLQVLGGSQGLGVIEGILSLPRQTAYRRPAYPSVFDKAAVVFRSMTLNHPFVDGNKRMAVAATLAFLAMNDWIVVATDDEIVHLALGVASGGIRERAELARWLQMNSVPFEDVVAAKTSGKLEDLLGRFPGTASLSERRLLALMLDQLQGEVQELDSLR